MNKNQYTAAPSVAAVHDMSSVGRCALTVVIPALAAMGIQPIPLPTAVLSTHTGGYSGMATRDLTEYMDECIDHWKGLSLRLDAVYSGYLASVGQEETVRRLMQWQKRENNALLVVDPVMGDEGSMYSAIPADMPFYMRRLCNEADVITPNLTEAALMLNMPYPKDTVDKETLLKMVGGFDAGVTVLTGVSLDDGRHVNACHIRETGETWLCAYRRIPVHYPGTGDLFTSVLCGYMLQGMNCVEAMRRATVFLEKVIGDTWHTQSEVRAGVQLEKGLRYLLGGEALGELPPAERLK